MIDDPQHELFDEDDDATDAYTEAGAGPGTVPAPLSEEAEAERKVFHLRFDEHTPVRLDSFLATELTDYSRSFLQDLIDTGHVTVSPIPIRKLRRSHKLIAGSTVRVVVPPPIKLLLEPQPIPIEFLYQDEHIAVINKQPGLSVHPAPDHHQSTLVNALLHCVKDLSGIGGVERPGIVHRLDKDTSGVLVIAKEDQAHRGLAAQFKERLVRKTYQAIVRGEPRYWEGHIDKDIGRSKIHRKKMAVYPPGHTRSSQTDYRVLEIFRGYALVECYPRTGRTHQIRVHMADLKLPVSCDKLYGREKRVFLSELENKPRKPDEIPIIARQALHAAGIAFRHPVTHEEMAFNAPLHQDMLDFLHALQRYRSPPRTTP